MEAIAERARQALGFGRSKDFEPTSLDSHHKMIQDLGQTADLVGRYHRAVKAFEDVTSAFLQSSSKVLLDTPYPRAFYQTSLSSDALPTFTPIPCEHMNLFSRDVHEQLKDTVPGAVDKTVHAKLMQPVEQWLRAYESAKERVNHLDRGRLAYDAARRKLLAVLTETGITEREREARLVKREKEHEAKMAHFEVEEANIYAQLLWLTSQGARIKAHIADLLNFTYASSQSHRQEPLILEPFPLRVLETPVEQLKRFRTEAGGVAGGPGWQMAVEPGDEIPPSELQERKEHLYEGKGTGRRETRLAPESLHFGLGSASRHSTQLPADVVGDVPDGMQDTTDKVMKPMSKAEKERAKGMQIIPSPRVKGPSQTPEAAGAGMKAPAEQAAVVHRVVTSGKTDAGTSPEVTARSSVVATQALDDAGQGVAVVTTRTVATAAGGTPEEAAALAAQAGAIAGATAGEAAREKIEGYKAENEPGVGERITEGAADMAGRTREAVGRAGAKTKEVLIDRPYEALMNRFEMAKAQRQLQREEELLQKAQEWKEKFGGSLLLPLSRQEIDELRNAREQLHREFVLSRASQIQTAEELETLWLRAEATEADQIEQRTRALRASFVRAGQEAGE